MFTLAILLLIIAGFGVVAFIRIVASDQLSPGYRIGGAIGQLFVIVVNVLAALALMG